MKDRRIELFADSKYNVTLWGSVIRCCLGGNHHDFPCAHSPQLAVAQARHRRCARPAPLQLRNAAQFELPKLIRDPVPPPDSAFALINTEPSTPVRPLPNPTQTSSQPGTHYHLQNLPCRAVTLRVWIALQASNPQAGAHLHRLTVLLRFLFHKRKRRIEVPHHHCTWHQVATAGKASTDCPQVLVPVGLGARQVRCLRNLEGDRLRTRRCLATLCPHQHRSLVLSPPLSPAIAGTTSSSSFSGPSSTSSALSTYQVSHGPFCPFTPTHITQVTPTLGELRRRLVRFLLMEVGHIAVVDISDMLNGIEVFERILKKFR